MNDFLFDSDPEKHDHPFIVGACLFDWDSEGIKFEKIKQ
jgi:hypothetical protein